LKNGSTLRATLPRAAAGPFFIPLSLGQ